MDFEHLYSRETLAGNDRSILEQSVAAVVGCGAAGNNIALNFALLGVRELRCIDYDIIEPSNLTRSPLFKRDCAADAGTRARHKAREVALGAHAKAYARDPVSRFAVARIEELGLGALVGAGVVISAVDSFAVRGYLADASRLLGIPLVEVGFSGASGHMSVFPNRSAEEPCFRCLHADIPTGGVSCALYARKVVEAGMTPATQSIASAIGSIAAEAAVRALHGEFPLAGKMVHFDVRTGASRAVLISADPECRGAHRILSGIKKLEVRAKESAARILAAAREFAETPVLHLPAPFLVEAPCSLCGARVIVRKPSWAVREPPACGKCAESSDDAPAPLVTASVITSTDQLANTACRKLGLKHGAVFEIEDLSTGHLHACRLEGSAADLFVTLPRTKRNETGGSPHVHGERKTPDNDTRTS
ncbi:MAG: ThiF family adenylyltransferase [Deltaproteobacteria bacterium]|nr:ThiF family adenylyltransferase [Deltaproteobacteria bacterium]